MRYTPVTCALALGLACVSSVVSGQKSDTQLDPRSVQLVVQGNALAAEGNLDGANDLIESALVRDPRNRSAYVSLARIAQKQELNGKAIRLYREALKIEPNDLSALAGQGEAMVAKGAVEKAKENLARIEKLCLNRCDEQVQLAAVIAKGPPQTVLTAKNAPTTPPVEEKN
ncbi:tetratricopeptide repeat protein [Sphingomonas sp. C3-2]|uniref:tetratricopeptide repeat protein n=1 Tax=Sphingomonas sp. C3-2 TaxID=3062169 RepID=UPI00294A9D28|nr:hypothetical protein [Sphingomonas sp. C3-2]WOK36920.1 hypothetical protein QYC26_01615 [Sphingomonas sp. C3-2]